MKTSDSTMPKRGGGIEQHARRGFAARGGGPGPAGFVRNLHPVDFWQRAQHAGVDGFDDFPALRAAAHVGLIRGDDEQKPGRFQPCAPGGHVVVELELLHAARRIGQPVPHDRPVDHAIAVEKHRARPSLT